MVESKKKCNLCGSNSTYELSKTLHLCGVHLEEYIYKKFKRAVRNFRVLKPGIKVSVKLDYSLSNIVLLDLVLKLIKEYPMKMVPIKSKLLNSKFNLSTRDKDERVSPVIKSTPDLIFLSKSADEIAIELIAKIFSSTNTLPKLSSMLVYRRKGMVYCCPLWQITEKELELYATIKFSEILEDKNLKRLHEKFKYDECYISALKLISDTKSSVPNIEARIISLFEDFSFDNKRKDK
ncbi:MAG: hypothetical protein N3E37_01520 [Candidatus Micrarchaeota archaeon]|nr:hypothetical protein [Candidatus Micrarchaeota archaeon]